MIYLSRDMTKIWRGLRCSFISFSICCTASALLVIQTALVNGWMWHFDKLSKRRSKWSLCNVKCHHFYRQSSTDWNLIQIIITIAVIIAYLFFNVIRVIIIYCRLSRRTVLWKFSYVLLLLLFFMLLRFVDFKEATFDHIFILWVIS